MTLHFPGLEFAVMLPLLGALFVSFLRDPLRARHASVIITGVTLLCTLATWIDFAYLGDSIKFASDPFDVVRLLTGQELFDIDNLSAPLLPLVALLYFLTTLTTLHIKIRRFSFGLNLVSEGIVLATFSCDNNTWGIITLLSLAAIPPFIELRARNKPTRVYLIHMGLFVALLIGGQLLIDSYDGQIPPDWAVLPLLAAVLIRSGIIPFHCWVTDLFEHASFGTALLFVTPITGAYAAVHLILPIAGDSLLRVLGLISLITAVYTAGMALVQREARRLFCYLFLSHSALVLMGLEMLQPYGLTGALCVWLSVGLSLGGFGLVLRALESRRGRLLLHDFQGLYEQTPTLAVCFALLGLASVGFPGTIGFIGMEMLVDGAVETYPSVGIAVVIATALNGIAVIHTYFIIFTGTQHRSMISLQIGWRERTAVLGLAALILLGGIIPQPGVHSRHLASQEILRERATHPELDDDHDEETHDDVEHNEDKQHPDNSHAPKD